VSADIAALVAAARSARALAYAPYSGFAVGAAIACDDGTIVTASNFENASYGLSLCAEAVAIASASARGLLHRAQAIALAGDSIAAPAGTTVTPCGRCRQMLQEAERIADRAIAIYCAPAAGQGMDGVVRFSLGDLLPHAFGPDVLPAERR
jgi:cytidine deaminase